MRSLRHFDLNLLLVFEVLMRESFVTMLPVRLVEPPKELPTLKMTLIQHGLFANDPALIWLTQLLIEFADTFQQQASSGERRPA